jgi:hypothetical protein
MAHRAYARPGVLLLLIAVAASYSERHSPFVTKRTEFSSVLPEEEIISMRAGLWAEQVPGVQTFCETVWGNNSKQAVAGVPLVDAHWTSES